MARKKYRSKLEKVINENCELTYETTVEDCQKWFNILNRELFNNNSATSKGLSLKENVVLAIA